MEKHEPALAMPEGLDDDILQLLAENQGAVDVPPALHTRLRTRLLAQVAQENACLQPGFQTVRGNEGEWIEARPGAHIKILHQEGDSGLLTYLARLAPGFEMHGHPHPFDEECIMLEGDLWLGDLKLQAGDYHFAAKGLHHGRLRSENGALVFLKGALPA